MHTTALDHKSETRNGKNGSSQAHRMRVVKGRRRASADRDLEEHLSAALVAGDKELDHILREFSSISSALQSGKPDATALRIAAHPAVWRSVEHMLLERELRHLALSDDLTCLYNRRGFYAAATQQLKMTRRNEKPAVLLFCDLDRLKAINDSFGHSEGDLALVRTADALEAAFRDSDVLARLGGDEFAVLATDLTAQNEQTVIGRLRESLRDTAKDEWRYELSLSVGTAWFDPRTPESLGDLMARADRAMYEEKHRRGSMARDENLNT
ncbi:MAG: GGDEF domain-containing protein [Candidatus Acidiferrales bacterium]